MSLDTLISIEITKFKETRDITILLNVEKIVEVLSEEDFGFRYLTSLGFTRDKVIDISDSLKINGIFKELIYVNCQNKSNGGLVSISQQSCPLCQQNFDEDNHEYEPWLKRVWDKSQIKSLQFKIIEQLLNIFLDQQSMSNYLDLKRNITNIVPLIGAGFSVPIGAPSWKELFLELKNHIHNPTHQATYEDIINEYDFFEGIRLLKRFSGNIQQDDQLKVKACEIIEEKIDYNIPKDGHNYFDLQQLNFPFYLTTNYDNAINHYQDNFSLPLELEKIHDIQAFLRQNRQRNIHLHGILDMPQSIVLTEDDYENKYNNEIFKTRLAALMAAKSILFLGFSFSDVYFKKIYSFIFDNIRGTHFIVTKSITRESYSDLICRNIYPIVLNITQDTTKSQKEYIYALKILFRTLKGE